MLETPEMDTVELRKVSSRSVFQEEKGCPSPRRERLRLLKQLTRFSLIGGLNTLIDIVVLNLLLLLWSTNNTLQILIYNALAYAAGASNSFVCNKYWTFQQRQSISLRELLRFAATTLAGVTLNSTMLWLAGLTLRPLPLNATLWTNASKVLAISATMLISYAGMRLWVFTSNAR